MLIHTVTKEDSLEGIATRYHLSVAKLIEDNSLSAPYAVTEGQTLFIPLPARFHTVRGGEDEADIAERYQTDIDTLKQENPAFCQSGVLYPGQVLTVSPPERMQALVIGCVDSPISLPVFLAFLPYLSFVALSPSLRRDALLRYAREATAHGVSPLCKGDACPLELLPYFNGWLLEEQEGYRIRLKDGEACDTLLWGSHPDPARCYRLLASPLFVNGEAASASLLPRLLRILRREGGIIERGKDGYARFLYTEGKRGKGEGTEICFADAEKEKAVLEGVLQEGFRSFIIRDEGEWSHAGRFAFASLFSPIKPVKAP